MKRRYGQVTFTAALGLLLWFLLPEPVFADNCGSLSDCFSTLRAALAATVGVGLFAVLLSLGLDFLPGIGTVKGLIEAVRGRDLVTNHELAWWERILGIVPFAGGVIGAGVGISRVAGNVGDLADTARAVDRIDDVAKAGRAVDKADAAADTGRATDNLTELPATIREPGWLSATEGTQLPHANGKLGPPSHPLTKHGPSVDLADLQKRVANPNGPERVTKFSDYNQMERAIGNALDAKQADINIWLQSKPDAGSRLPIDFSPQMGNLGEGFQRLPDGTVMKINQPLESLTVVLKYDGKGGYIIQTAYPIP